MAEPTTTLITLQSASDWRDWYEVLEATARAKDVFELINVNAVSAPAQPVRPSEPEYENVAVDALSYADLFESQKDHYKTLFTEYKYKMDLFNQQQRALAEIRDYINASALYWGIEDVCHAYLGCT